MIVENKSNELDVLVFFEVLDGGLQGDVRCLMQRVAVRPGANRGERDTLQILLRSKPEAFEVRALQQRCFVTGAVRVPRSDCVDDVSGFEVPPNRDDCFSRGTSSDFSAFLHDAWSTSAMDSTIHPTASREPAVRSVHDRISGFPGDIPISKEKGRGVDVVFHRILLPYNRYKVFNGMGFKKEMIHKLTKKEGEGYKDLKLRPEFILCGGECENTDELNY